MKAKNPQKIGVVAVALLLGGACLRAAEPSVQQVFEDAKSAYHRGDLVSAKAGFESVVSADPRFSTARAYLARVTYELKERDSSGASNLQRSLESVIVPSIEFNQATLGSVLEFIPQKTAELTGEKIRPSIIFNGDAALLEQKKVTLKLSNMPMSEILRYVGELTGVVFKFDKHAIVGSPLGAAPAGAAGAEAPVSAPERAPGQ